MLRERSPLHAADRITKPLLIGQGANDPRVKQAEADQIIEAMRAKDLPVTYVLYPGGGARLCRAGERPVFQRHCGDVPCRAPGRAERTYSARISKAPKFEVREGAAEVPGLEPCLGRKQPEQIGKSLATALPSSALSATWRHDLDRRMSLAIGVEAFFGTRGTMDSAYIRSAIVSVLVGVVGLASYGVVRQTREIGEGRIVMATGSSQYYELAESYRRELERYGVKFEVLQRTEGFATLKALLDPDSGINAGFIKGGLVGSLQGRLATRAAKGRYAQYEKARFRRAHVLRADLGVLRAATCPIASLRDLRGKKILTGTRESGARRIANQLLNANGIGRDNANADRGRRCLPMPPLCSTGGPTRRF